MAAPTLAFVAATAKSLQFSFVNPDGAGANFVAEANRAADFASDDSLFLNLNNAGAGSANGFEMTGLPGGTIWNVRLLSKATGQYSSVLPAATLSPALVTTYAGYSIDKALLVVPDPIGELVSLNGYEPLTGFPLQNLLRDDPVAVARFFRLDVAFDFSTSGMAIDTIAVLGSNLNDDAVWNIQAFSDAARTNMVFQTGTVQFRCSPTIGQRPSYHGLARFAPQTARYWRLAINAPGSLGIVLRNLVVGRARTSTNADKGTNYGANDLGSATRTRFGVLDAVRGWRGKTVSFSMSWLSETEFQAKWADLPGLVGTTKSVLAIPNSKRNIHLNDRLAFGIITQMGAENVQSFKYAQNLEINSIY